MPLRWRCISFHQGCYGASNQGAVADRLGIMISRFLGSLQVSEKQDLQVTIAIFGGE
jgi:hypothetical protein